MNKLYRYAMCMLLFATSVQISGMHILPNYLEKIFGGNAGPRQTRLYEACRHGQLMMVERLLAHRGHVDVNQPNNDGVTPLMAACGIGHAPIISALLASRAEVNLIDRAGDTALLYAIRSRSLAAVKTLCEQGHPDLS